MTVNTSFKSEVKSFVKENKVLCTLTLGLAVLGYAAGNLGGRGISWLAQASGYTKKTDTEAQKIFKEKAENIGIKIQENLTAHKTVPISAVSSSQLKDLSIISLPNYTSVHINDQGEAFYLTPIGGSNIQQYEENLLDDYTKACLEISLKMAYDSNGHLIDSSEDEKKVFDHSIAEKIDTLPTKEHVVNLWIQACHFIIVKSDQGRFWFLHYDPGQAKMQQNKIDGISYSRPNYSELRPILPYNLDGVTLKDNENIQVVVIHPNSKYNINDSNNLTNGEFDATAFKNFVGENKVTGVKTICYKDFVKENGEDQIEIDFNTKSETLTMHSKGNRNKLICNIENLF